MYDALYSIFKDSGVKFWIMGGTLLGSYREKALIDHDDDIDIGMLEEYEIELCGLNTVVRRYGYYFTNSHFGYRMFLTC